MKINKSVLVIAAHPDDEILGCGATMARHVTDGDKVEVVIVAEGITARHDLRDSKSNAAALEALKEKAIQANRVLGVEKVRFLEFPDNRLDSVDLIDIVKSLENLLTQVQPDVIYTHFPGDLNVDHQLTARATLTACRPLPESSVREILFFEVLSATEWFPGGPLQNGFFQPNYLVEATTTLEKKLTALAVYNNEMREFPHARSIEASKHLAHLRGASVGVHAAEAFQLARYLR